MQPVKYHFVIVFVAMWIAPLTTFAFSFAGSTACLLIGVADLHELPNGILAESTSEEDSARYMQLTRDARARIEATFGTVEAHPILVYFNNPEVFGPFKLNSFGSTQITGSRTCVMIGPKGQNVDVVAHELMHAELHHRVGYWQQFMQVPTWFDEGVAMQVDYRAHFALQPSDVKTAGYVRELSTVGSFLKGDEQTVVRNYASAKEVVASWLKEVGTGSLYARFNRLKNGEAFKEVLTK